LYQPSESEVEVEAVDSSAMLEEDPAPQMDGYRNCYQDVEMGLEDEESLSLFTPLSEDCPDSPLLSVEFDYSPKEVECTQMMDVNEFESYFAC
jgi:hypothetical protein